MLLCSPRMQRTWVHQQRGQGKVAKHLGRQWWQEGAAAHGAGGVACQPLVYA